MAAMDHVAKKNKMAAPTTQLRPSFLAFLPETAPLESFILSLRGSALQGMYNRGLKISVSWL